VKDIHVLLFFFNLVIVIKIALIEHKVCISNKVNNTSQCENPMYVKKYFVDSLKRIEMVKNNITK